MIKNPQLVLQQLFKHQLSFTPTQDQQKTMELLEVFTSSQDKNSLFLLKGYAGTGKTTTLSVYINWLTQLGYKTVLLAPTGRAAKVLSSYSKKIATTIHKKIYYQKNVDGRVQFTLQQNKHTKTIFIIDEASMIGNSGGMGGSFSAKTRTLLDDVIDYVFSGTDCKLVFTGDTAQLPPIGVEDSPALDEKYLSRMYPILVRNIELKQVTRQSELSGILKNATQLRGQMLSENFDISFDLELEDVKSIRGPEVEEILGTHYSRDGIDNCIVVCRSNKQANNYNKYIKFNVLWHEDEIMAGELMMVVRNNYYWLDDESKIGFIANGDMIEVLRVIDFEERFGFRFANVSMQLKDYPDEPAMEVKLLLDTLSAESPSLGKDDGRRLYEAVYNSYDEIRDKRKRLKEVKEDPYFNALQVKYGYAITCHKSQGGQWDNVFVDQGYLTDEMINKEYLRWLYTGITRAKEQLYLVNFHERFFS